MKRKRDELSYVFCPILESAARFLCFRDCGHLAEVSKEYNLHCWVHVLNSSQRFSSIIYVNYRNLGWIREFAQHLRHLRITRGVFQCDDLPMLPNLETLVTLREPEPLSLLAKCPSLKTLAVRITDADIYTIVERFKPLQLDLLFVSFHDGPMRDSCLTFKKHLMIAEHQFKDNEELWQAVVFK